MSFNFGNLPEQKLEVKKGKFIRPGVQTLILKDLYLESSKNTGNQRPVFFMETEPITDEGWEGFENHKGQIGKIAGNFGYYLKNDDQKEEFANFLKAIMQSTNTWADCTAQHGNTDFTTLDELVEAAKPFLAGTKARYFVCGEQYHKLDGSGVGLKLKFPTRRAVESLEVTDSKLPKFDETNQNHFKKIPKSEVNTLDMEPKAPKMDDLPF